MGNCLFEGPAAEVHVRHRRCEHEGLDSRSRVDGDPLELRATGGKQPGQFYAVHSIVLDSKSNIYTTETFDGRRLQRFLMQGMQTIEKGKDQLTVWPRSATSTN